ncbi:MAG TPA: aldolase/citrate lyase family protein [Kofleriaceae bacterium]
MAPKFDLAAEKSRLLAELISDVKAGKRPLGLSTALNTPSPLEIAGRFGYQWAIIDQEHTLLTSQGLIEQLRAAELSRIPAIVKVNSTDPILIRDALDAGASGIQLPGTDTVADLKKALSNMRYTLRGGTRGICPIQRSTNYFTFRYSGDDDWEDRQLDFADQALLMPTVETVTAMRNLEEMLTIDECPIWHIGPMDLGQSLGLNHSDPTMADVLFRTVRQLAARIHKAGKYVCYPLIPAPLPKPGTEEAALFGQKKDAIGQAMSAIGVDMPYTVDSSCMGFGMSAMINSRNASLTE